MILVPALPFLLFAFHSRTLLNHVSLESRAHGRNRLPRVCGSSISVGVSTVHIKRPSSPREDRHARRSLPGRPTRSPWGGGGETHPSGAGVGPES